MGIKVNSTPPSRLAADDNSVLQLMERIGQSLISVIRPRVQNQHVDVNGQPFKKYSAQYAFWKGQRALSKGAGRKLYKKSIEGLEGNTKAVRALKKQAKIGANYSVLNEAVKVNLTLTGRMMQALRVVTLKVKNGVGSVEVGWTGTELKKAVGNQEKREFFGIGNSEQERIDNIFKQWCDEQTRKL